MAEVLTSPGGPLGPPIRPEGSWALARLPVGRHGLPREFVERNQRNRLIFAALDVFTTTGYAETSVAELIAAAGVSRKTFYAHFADKEDCLLATHDLLVDWLTEEARRATADVEDWPGRIIAVIAALARPLAGDPRLARLLTVEVLRAGAPARARHDAVVRRLADSLAEGRDSTGDASSTSVVLEPVLVSGALASVARLLDGDMAERLVDLASELSEILLNPYLGPTAAHQIAEA